MKLKNIFATLLFAAMSSSMMAQNKLFIEDFTINPGESKDLNVMMDNPSYNVWMVQFDIELPEGLAIKTNTSGKPIIKLLRKAVDPDTEEALHTLSSNILANGDVRVLIKTDVQGDIPGTSGALCKFTVTASDTFGAGVITIKGGKLVAFDKTVPACELPDATTNANDPTGISVIEAEKALNGEAYTIGGVKADEATKGIIIQNGKKVIK